jgi:hypothetical protein
VTQSQASRLRHPFWTPSTYDGLDGHTAPRTTHHALRTPHFPPPAPFLDTLHIRLCPKIGLKPPGQTSDEIYQSELPDDFFCVCFAVGTHFQQQSGKVSCLQEVFGLPELCGLFEGLLRLGIVFAAQSQAAAPVGIDGLLQDFLQGGQGGAATWTFFRQLFRMTQVAFASQAMESETGRGHGSGFREKDDVVQLVGAFVEGIAVVIGHGLLHPADQALGIRRVLGIKLAAYFI